jgi:CheY-like chemotaxis protein
MPRLRRVLVADDEPDIRTVARLALETVGGLEVRLCASGDEVSKSFASYRPDLVVLDVMMPNVDGIAALAAIRSQPGGESVPVVFLTAKAHDEELRQLELLGAADVIVKPFDPMTLATRLCAAWGRAHGH